MKGLNRVFSLRGLAAFTLAAIVAMGISWTAAQATGDDYAEIEKLRQEMKTDRQAIVAENLKLTESEAAAFWPIYREYRSALDTQHDRSVKLIGDYAAKYGSMTDADASVMLKEWLSIEKEKAALREKYVKKVGKVLPPLKTTRYFQIENKLDSIVSLGLASEIPLVK
jgi:hypothetical protein